MSASRVLSAARRVASVQAPRFATRSFAGHGAKPAADAHGHDDHAHEHKHLVFHPEEWNPMGAPLAIMLTCVVGGLGTVYAAYSLQMSKWTPAK